MGEERNEQLEEKVLDSQEIDTIGEILNISMGSAATAGLLQASMSPKDSSVKRKSRFR